MLKTQNHSSYQAHSNGSALTLNRTPEGIARLAGMNGHGKTNGAVRETKPRCRNKILAALPQDVWQRLELQSRRVLLHQRDIIQESGTPAKYAYFIESGMISLVVDSQDGSQVEVGVIGQEGVVNGMSLLSNTASFHRAIVQIPGSAYRFPLDVLLEEYRQSSALQEILHNYTFFLMAQTSQSVLCNRIHTVEERLSRWLLTARSIIHSDDLELTHEFIAHMLGTRRSGVTVALGILQQAGMIDTTRGRITIIDEAKVESCSCECYGVVQSQLQSFQNKISSL